MGSYTYKRVNATALSTTTKVTINGGVDFTVPQQVVGLTEITPFIIPVVETAGETRNANLIAESNAINVNPTVLFVPPVSSGLGATFNTIHPVLPAFKWNVPIDQGTAPPITFSAQGQVTNTSEPLVGALVGMSDVGTIEDKQTFWMKRNGVTSSGTAATTVTETTYGLQGGTLLHTIYAAILPTTQTVSESQAIFVNFASQDLQTPLPVDCLAHPLTSFLGATGSALTGAFPRWPVSVPMNPVVNLSPQITLLRAVTVAANIITGVGFYR